jgi:hypothetical protein
MPLDLVMWAAIFLMPADSPDLPLLREDGDGLAAGWAADAFPVLGSVAGLGRADAFWVAVAAAAALLAARSPSGAVDSPPHLASEAKWRR